MNKKTGKFYAPSEITIRVCDRCEKELTIENEILFDHTWRDGCDSYGEESEFCSIICLREYIHENEDYITMSPHNESISLITSKEIMMSLIKEN